jgi:hypothetical protein
METIRKAEKPTANTAIFTTKEIPIGKSANTPALKRVIARHVIKGGIKSAVSAGGSKRKKRNDQEHATH